MIIDILNLLKREEEIIEVNRQIPNFIQEIQCEGPIDIQGRICIENQSLEIALGIKLSINMVCSRCIENFAYPLQCEINESLDLTEYQGILQNDTLDLTELIRENILIAIPIKALCDEDCKGLCTVCGVNMNVHNCDCNKDQIDPRLSVLNNLLNGNE